MNKLLLMLVLQPVAVILYILKFSAPVVFIFSSLAIIPLVAILSQSTEEITKHTGPKIGGLLNATMSNIPELMIGISSVTAGMYELVLYSMAGAIISNILLVLGASIFLGGIGRKYQYFNKYNARSNFLLLITCAFSMIVPFALRQSPQITQSALINVSFFISLILILTYLSGLVFTLVTHKSIFVSSSEDYKTTLDKNSLGKAAIMLSISAVLIAIDSNILVSQIEVLINKYRVSEVFIGIIILPILGNVAENISAVLMAVKDKVEISIEIAIGSSIQIALFVSPLLVLLSFIIGSPMAYIFGAFEIVAVLASVGVSLFVFQDGRTNWLEGIVLLGCYVMLAVAFYFL